MAAKPTYADAVRRQGCNLELPAGNTCRGHPFICRANYGNVNRGCSSQATLNVSNQGIMLSNTTMVQAWGDSLCVKSEDCYRIATKNIGSLGVRPNSLKEDQLKNWMRLHQIDVTCLQEINVNWAKIRGRYRIHERFKKKDKEEFKLSYAFNKNEVRNTFQRGGVCIHTCGPILATTTTTGNDPRNLGRWSWFKFHGSDGIVVRVVSVYIPCKNLDPTQSGSVYAQHRRYYLRKNIESCPIENLKNELLNEIDQWVRNGEKIIVCGDFNENVDRSMFVQDLQRLNITSVMKTHTDSTPPTYNRGTDTIDGIFASPGLKVLACGFSDFGDGPGDHRTVFVDIQRYDIEGFNISSIQRLPRRRLISTNKKVSDKFNTEFKQQLNRNSIIERTRVLRQTVGNRMSMDQMLGFEKIERIMQSAFECANNRCRKFHSGEVAFAPDDVQKYSMRAELWDLVVQKKLGCHINYSRIRRLAKKCNISNPMQYQLEYAKKKRKRARKKYYRVRPHSYELRREWLEKKAEYKEKEEGVSAAVYLHQLVNREDTRESHRRIKVAHKKFGSGGTKMLTIPSQLDPDLIEEVIDKEELEDILMRTNYDKFSAAKETPLAQEPLLSMIGATAATPTADALLYSQPVDLSMCERYSRNFLKAAHIPESMRSSPPVSAKITTDQHIQFWKSQNEKTQSSKSGMHFGFFKSTVKDFSLAETIATLVSLPFETGYSPERWRQSVNVHLLKKPGEYSPQKQRTIHLIEASLSEGCKIIFSRRMMWKAKQFNMIPSDQFARKHSKSSDAALLNVLLFDFMRLNRTCGISIANDLNSCYDRMVHTGTSLALRRMGAPKTAVECMSKCIQYMKHYIRTAYGDSSTYYGGKVNDPLQGGGQGNPAAPPMWIALTVILISIMNQLAPGVTIVTPISLLVTTITVIMYVDDSSIFILGRSNEYPTTIITRAQKYLDEWCNYLWVTGGALRPEKCWYTLVDFRWEDGFWFYQEDDSRSQKLHATNALRISKPITQLKISDGARILGVRIAADGNNQLEKEYQIKCTKTWAERVNQGYLTRFDAILDLKTTISKTWAYPLSSTTFSFQDAVDIMTPAYQAVLPKMGSNRNLPLVYRYAPISAQGLGLPHIYTMQGTAHIQVILSHIKRSDRIGKLIESEIESLSLEIGTMNNIFTLNYETWSVGCTPTWITSTWQFCSKHSIIVHGPRVELLSQREHDFTIMDKIMENRHQFSDKDIILINQCRIFLQVMFLSDMISGDGRVILDCFLAGTHPIDRQSQWKWPKQNNPSTIAWNQWRRALSIVLNISSTNKRCNPRLGKWFPNRHMNMIWKFSYDSTTNLAYTRVGTVWHNYKCLELTRSRGVFELQSTSFSPTMNAQRLSVYDKLGNIIYSSGVSESISSSQSPISLESSDWWNQHVAKESTNVQEILENTAMSCSQRHLISYLRHEDITIVTDGSFYPNECVAAAAFSIETVSSQFPLAKGYCRVTGSQKELSPYRAELGGIHLIVHVLSVLDRITCLKKNKFRIHCDCEAVISVLRKHPDSITLSTKHHDIIWDIHYMLSQISCTLQFIWVKGHQSQSDIQHNQLARMNDTVDELAKACAQYCIQVSHEQESIEYGKQFWSVQYNGIRIINNITKTLSHHIHKRELLKHLQEKYELTDREMSVIDWDAVGPAMRSLKLNEQLWVTKHVSHFNGLGVKMAQYNLWETSKCPRCHIVDENHSHLISCSHFTCQNTMCDGLLRMSKTLDAWNTEPNIHLIFIQKLRNPRMLMLDLIPDGCSLPLIQAAKEQDLLGYDRFIEGRLTKSWRCIQQNYYDSQYPDSRRTGLRWASLVIKNILRYCREHWLVRNKYVEENKINREQEVLKLRILDQLEDEFSKGVTGVPIDERFLFNIDLEQLKKLSTAAQRDWLDHVYTARHFYGERSTRERQDMQRFMERWLRPRGRRRTRGS